MAVSAVVKRGEGGHGEVGEDHGVRVDGVA